MEYMEWVQYAYAVVMPSLRVPTYATNVHAKSKKGTCAYADHAKTGTAMDYFVN